MYISKVICTKNERLICITLQILYTKYPEKSVKSSVSSLISRHELDILYAKQDGFLLTILVQGKEEEIERVINKKRPIIFEKRPLSIEEMFRYEGERIGYDISEIVY